MEKVASTGPRGMRVTITLPAARRAYAPRIAEAMAAYLFEAILTVSDAC